MCHLFYINEIGYIHIRSCQSFSFCLLVLRHTTTQLAGLVSSAVLLMCMFVHNRVFKCTHRVEDSSVKRGFADFAVEMFCVD